MNEYIFCCWIASVPVVCPQSVSFFHRNQIEQKHVYHGDHHNTDTFLNVCNLHSYVFKYFFFKRSLKATKPSLYLDSLLPDTNEPFS